MMVFPPFFAFGLLIHNEDVAQSGLNVDGTNFYQDKLDQTERIIVALLVIAAVGAILFITGLIRRARLKRDVVSA